MTHSHSAHLRKTGEAAQSAQPSGVVAPLDRLSLLRLSAGDRALGAIIVIVSLWAGVYWALH